MEAEVELTVSAEGSTGFSCRSEGHVGRRWMMWATAHLDVTVWMKTKMGSAAVEIAAAYAVEDVAGYKMDKTDASMVDNAGMGETWASGFVGKDTIAVDVLADNGAEGVAAGRDADRRGTFAGREEAAVEVQHSGSHAGAAECCSSRPRKPR